MPQSHFLHRHLPISPSTRPLYAITYICAVPLFSIAFLVFLNSSLSFLLTQLLHIPAKRLGGIVGHLGFIDELVAVFTAPLWGLASDTRLGTRGVSFLGYVAISLSFVLFVTLHSVSPGLVIARIVFSVGAAAVTTMVTAILPEMTSAEGDGTTPAPTGKLAGLVGLVTGLGALLALGILLPLPTRFSESPNISPGEAVRLSYFTVAALALGIAVWCALGLPPPRNPGRTSTWREVKAWVWTRIWGGDPRVFREEESNTELVKGPSGLKGLWAAAKVASEDGRILVGYVGGFVARAASVGISLFIPLYVNHYFVSTGKCQPTDPSRTKDECRKAYILASTLTGTSQLTALLLAPVFGIMTDRCSATPHLRNLPILFASILGILGFTLFSMLPSPEHWAAFIFAALTGASQIGAIVASLGLLSQGVVDESSASSPSISEEQQPLLGDGNKSPQGRQHFKGSIAGVYSLAGAGAILLLTKAGGKAFDAEPGSPFWMLAGFNGVLAVVGAAEMARTWAGAVRRR